MAQTNFALLTAEQKTVWSRTLWRDARELSFLSKFLGKGERSVVQVITELTTSEKGERVLMHLLADLVGDGVANDNEREGQEEAMKSYTEDITIGLLSHGVRDTGKLANQKTVISFRENARDVLAYWLANRIDQLAILTLSGIAYTYNVDGSTRGVEQGSALAELAFAADVTAPTANRHVRVSGNNTGGHTYTGLVAGNTATMTVDDKLTYEALVDLGVYAKTNYVKGLMEGGKEYFILLLRPEGVAQLKKDADYKNAIWQGAPRSDTNPFFSGATVTVDGLVIHEHRMVFNTKGATSGVDKWGSGSDIDGSRGLLLGSQALGMIDLTSPAWNEKMFQYDSSVGINVDKMLGFRKPRFHSAWTDSVEDFGVIAVDHAI
jgi:N4-gp56 family major capsid protein